MVASGLQPAANLQAKAQLTQIVGTGLPALLFAVLTMCACGHSHAHGCGR
jgi:hypothetical protein